MASINNATANKMWQSQFSLKKLLQIQEEFEAIGALQEPKFIEIVKRVLSRTSTDAVISSDDTTAALEVEGNDTSSTICFDDEDLSHLFLMIDANSSGTITWREFSTYLFLSEKLTNPNVQVENLREEIFPKSIDAPYSTIKHADTILLITRIKRRFTYYKDVFLTAAHDGKLLAWNTTNLEFHSTVITKLDWITSVVHMRHSNRLVVSTTSGIKIYDIINREVFTVRYYDEIPPWLLAHASPMALSYYFDEKKVIEYLVIAGTYKFKI